MAKRTPLFESHQAAGARIVDFGGWDMPVNYGSQIEEHHAVRNDAGVFDVSHMTVLDVAGADAQAFLRRLLANDVARLSEHGKAMYSCMLTEEGGVVDDLIVYFFDAENYRLVVNASTRDKDVAWIEGHAADYDVSVNERDDLAMIAVQGPKARERVAPLVAADHRDDAIALKPFYSVDTGDLFIASTGYTGEDGWEILLPAEKAAGFWDQVIEQGVRPCGLGARDTLRLEAGMNLYGNDMDETTSPLESGLGWTIAWEPADRAFIGREAISKVRENTDRQVFRGLLLEDKGVLRGEQRVLVEGHADGITTSGGFSPTLERSIALARLPAGDYERAKVEVRKRVLDVRVVKVPFVRNGKILIDL